MKRETNWPPIVAGVLAVIAGLLAEIGWGEFVFVRALFAVLGAFIGWWLTLALLQVVIVKARGRNLQTALGDGLRANYLLLIALLITINLITYRYMRSGNTFDAVFGALINGAFWYGVMVALRWLWRKVYRLFRKGVPIEER